MLQGFALDKRTLALQIGIQSTGYRRTFVQIMYAKPAMEIRMRTYGQSRTIRFQADINSNRKLRRSTVFITEVSLSGLDAQEYYFWTTDGHLRSAHNSRVLGIAGEGVAVARLLD